MHILLISHSGYVIYLYDNTRLSYVFSVSGANVAMYCANQFHTELVKHEDYQNNLPEALKHVFSRMDELMQDRDEWRALANPRRVGLSLLCCLEAAACVQELQAELVGRRECFILSKEFSS